jgi:hypothetical protein
MLKILAANAYSLRGAYMCRQLVVDWFVDVLAFGSGVAIGCMRSKEIQVSIIRVVLLGCLQFQKIGTYMFVCDFGSRSNPGPKLSSSKPSRHPLNWTSGGAEGEESNGTTLDSEIIDVW